VGADGFAVLFCAQVSDNIKKEQGKEEKCCSVLDISGRFSFQSWTSVFKHHSATPGFWIYIVEI
jgi:hypothetical protein